MHYTRTGLWRERSWSTGVRWKILNSCCITDCLPPRKMSVYSQSPRTLCLSKLWHHADLHLELKHAQWSCLISFMKIQDERLTRENKTGTNHNFLWKRELYSLYFSHTWLQLTDFPINTCNTISNKLQSLQTKRQTSKQTNKRTKQYTSFTLDTVYLINYITILQLSVEKTLFLVTLEYLGPLCEFAWDKQIRNWK